MAPIGEPAWFVPRSTLAAWLQRFPTIRLAVVGDFFLDRYLVIDPALAEPSVETGLVAHQVVAVRNSPGAAGTVVNNLVALQPGPLWSVGIIGADGDGFELRRELQRRGARTDHLLATEERFTPTYTKPVRRHRQPGGSAEEELERLDIINRTPTPMTLEQQLIAALETVVAQVDAVVLLDQVGVRNHGVLTDTVRAHVLALAKQRPPLLFFADSRAALGEFTGVVIKANHHEAARAAGLTGSAEAGLGAARAAASALFARTGQPVLVTCGAEGTMVVTDEGSIHVPAFRVAGPIDVTGAGDSTTAGAVLARCAGATWPQAALVGNLVASITIQQLGTTGTATPTQLLRRYDEFCQSMGEHHPPAD